MSYERVIPRDLFNESKLLKCLGQLALLLHNYETRWPLRLEHEDSNESGFRIDLEPQRGELCCTNLVLTHTLTEKQIYLGSGYNSKEPYPLWFVSEDETNEGPVFNDDGSFADEFLKFISDS